MGPGWLGSLAKRGSLTRRLTVMNAGIIVLLTMAVVAIHLSVYQQMALQRSEQRALHLAGTVADFASSYLLDLRVNELNLVLHNLRSTGEVQKAFVVDSEGTVIADSSGDSTNILSTATDEAVIRVLQTGEPVSIVGTGSLEIGFPVRLSSSETGIVRLTVGTNEALNEVSEARGSTILIAGLILLLSLPLSLMLVRRMTGPLSTLTDHTKAVAQGDLQTKVAVDGEGELAELATSFNTMLDALHEKTERIRSMAYTDSLTGLANRARLNDTLAESMMTANDDRPVSVMLLDLDRFKQVNDTLGHEAGDRLLKHVARRLENALETACRHGPAGPEAVSHLIARLGGDEFVCLIDGERSQEVARIASERIIQALNQPFDIGGVTADIGTSIGVTWAPGAARTASELLREADQAMYRAKTNGRNCTVFHHEREQHDRYSTLDDRPLID
ncbi:MAG: diguanylate cyclase [Geminicoccaceae bacterium]